MRRTLVLIVGFACGCGMTGPTVRPIASPDEPLPRETRATVAVYRVLLADPFPNGPSEADAMRELFSTDSKPNDRRGYNWGLRHLIDGKMQHYITLNGAPDDAGPPAAELLASSNAPQPILPARARLVFHASTTTFKQQVMMRYGSIAIDGEPIALAEDVLACHIEENVFVDTDANGTSVTSKRPWLRVSFTPEGDAKLNALPPKTAACILFGDEAVTEAWYPDIADATFPVEGTSTEMRSRRAVALQAMCAKR